MGHAHKIIFRLSKANCVFIANLKYFRRNAQNALPCMFTSKTNDHCRIYKNGINRRTPACLLACRSDVRYAGHYFNIFRTPFSRQNILFSPIALNYPDLFPLTCFSHICQKLGAFVKLRYL